jgi:hypothetical protein
MQKSIKKPSVRILFSVFHGEPQPVFMPEKPARRGSFPLLRLTGALSLQ